MKVTNAEVKKLIADVISYTDNVDERKQRERRSVFERKFYKGRMDLLEMLKNNVEIGYLPADEKEIAAVVWTSLKDFQPDPTKRIVAERYIEGEIELTPQMYEALKHYARERQELPEVSAEAFEQFENLVK